MWQSPDASYRTLPPFSQLSGRPPGDKATWSRTLLAAEPLDLDHKHEIIRRVHQDRDRDGGAGTARIHNHDRVHEYREGCSRPEAGRTLASVAVDAT